MYFSSFYNPFLPSMVGVFSQPFVSPVVTCVTWPRQKKPNKKCLFYMLILKFMYTEFSLKFCCCHCLFYKCNLVFSFSSTVLSIHVLSLKSFDGDTNICIDWEMYIFWNCIFFLKPIHLICSFRIACTCFVQKKLSIHFSVLFNKKLMLDVCFWGRNIKCIFFISFKPF